MVLLKHCNLQCCSRSNSNNVIVNPSCVKLEAFENQNGRLWKSSNTNKIPPSPCWDYRAYYSVCVQHEQSMLGAVSIAGKKTEPIPKSSIYLFVKHNKNFPSPCWVPEAERKDRNPLPKALYKIVYRLCAARAAPTKKP